MTSNKANGNTLRFSGVPYESLYSEINRLRKRDNLEEISGLQFYLKLHDHVKVEPNLRVSEALENLKKAPQREPERPASAVERAQL